MVFFEPFRCVGDGASTGAPAQHLRVLAAHRGIGGIVKVQLQVAGGINECPLSRKFANPADFDPQRGRRTHMNPNSVTSSNTTSRCYMRVRGLSCHSRSLVIAPTEE